MDDREAVTRSLAQFPAPSSLSALRAALGQALGRKRAISLRELGAFLGYTGPNIHRTIDRLEQGREGRRLKGAFLLRGADLVHAVLPHFQDPVIVYPQWLLETPADESEDAGLYFLRHDWFPRAQFIACPWPDMDPGIHKIGYIRPDHQPFERYSLLARLLDPVGNAGDWTPFYETALHLLGQEINDAR